MEKYFKEAMKIIKAKSKKNKINKLKKSKTKGFIRNIFKRKNGKNTNIVLYDELHSYKENEMYNNIIAVTPEEHHKINNNLYKAEYMQNPFEILTEENLERLEKHCKKAVHYERGEIREEHEVILCLLYRYQEQQEQIKKQNKIIDSMAEVICRLDTMNNYNSWNNNIQEVKKYFEKEIIHELYRGK